MNKITTISGGVTAPIGYKAAGVHCGVRHNKTKRDIALIMSDVPASAAGVYTTNLVKGAPLIVTAANLADGIAQAVICNSGNANTCNANGIEIATKMCAMVAEATGVKETDVIVASTGVIGQPLNLEPISRGIPMLASALSVDGGEDAAVAIMTTDLYKKEIAVEFTLGGKTCRIGGIAKGSGMIAPNMATMLAFVTSDVAISPALLQKTVTQVTDSTFNMVTVDGDTSTNDMFMVMCNGLAGNAPITEGSTENETFAAALTIVATYLSRAIAADGEGATKLLEINVSGAADTETARKVAKSVASSSLFKAAMCGADANWGRVLCAIGYSGAAVDIPSVSVSFKSAAGEIIVCKNGAGVPFDEPTAKKILLEKDIATNISIGDGKFSATAWGCDLTYDYVKINGDYRS